MQVNEHFVIKILKCVISRADFDTMSAYSLTDGNWLENKLYGIGLRDTSNQERGARASYIKPITGLNRKSSGKGMLKWLQYVK